MKGRRQTYTKAQWYKLYETADLEATTEKMKRQNQRRKGRATNEIK